MVHLWDNYVMLPSVWSFIQSDYCTAPTNSSDLQVCHGYFVLGHFVQRNKFICAKVLNDKYIVTNHLKWSSVSLL